MLRLYWHLKELEAPIHEKIVRNEPCRVSLARPHDLTYYLSNPLSFSFTICPTMSFTSTVSLSHQLERIWSTPFTQMANNICPSGLKDSLLPNQQSIQP